ncbi:MAG: aminopeptidase P family protein [Coriobacteriia bacterium]|nr:aminopeptidase P family protein [Coriobacteriia bacterium]
MKKNLIITNKSDIFYLTGFYSNSNDAILYLTPKVKYFITDGRFINQFKEQVKGYKLIVSKKDKYKTLNSLLKEESYVSYDQISYKDYKKLNVNLKDSKNYILKKRAVKNKKEIEYIKKACDISQKSLLNTFKKIKSGITEIELKNILEEEMNKLGSEYPAFETIVASGPTNGASPHAIPTQRKIKEGEFITIDFGATYNNYCSDITRTIAFKSINKKQKDIYNTVLKAKRLCEKSLQPGIKFKVLNNIAKKVINKSNNPFLHSIGHGIGIDIHEKPTINQKLRNGNIHTIEPGIYIPKFGGVRIEDDYLINKNGYINLTNKITDELIIL